MSDGRRLLRAWVSPEAKNGFDTYATSHGTTITGLLEAIGLWYADHVADEPDLMTEDQRAIVRRARELDAGRRRPRRRE